MATISLCMIVKNEAAVLARCLESVGDAVDEIVIVDTGSSDQTKQIAAQFTDKIYDFLWCDDFSAARNFSFSKATMEFAFWLDADDVLMPADRQIFVAQKETLFDAADMVMMRYYTAFDESGNPTFSFYRERLIRLHAGFLWEGRVHEAISPAGRVVYSEAAVTHKSVKVSYTDRNLRIYEKQIADGVLLSPRDQFYYGRELYYHKQYDSAKNMLQTFLKSGAGWVENNIEACKILSYCYAETGDYFAALSALTDAFYYDTPRAEICCEIGRMLMQLQKYSTAIFWYELALKLPRNDTSGGFLCEECYGFLPCIQLCVCYDKLGEHETAKAYNERAGKIRPTSPAYLHNLEYFKSQAQHAESQFGIY